MTLNFNGAGLGDRISIASFGTQRKEAEATFKARVNQLNEDKNRFQCEIWEIEDKLEARKADLESAKQATVGGSPDDVELWDATRTLKKQIGDLERELRSKRRRNELSMVELEDKVSLEQTRYQSELAKIDQMEDQYLGDQDPDPCALQDVEAINTWDQRRDSTGSRSRIQTDGRKSPIPNLGNKQEKTEDDLSTRMMDLLTMQMKLLTQQSKNNNNDKFFARQTTGKDLPAFSGDSSEWPAFVAQYKQTSEACGFSAVENLYRLQKALRGKAKSTVQALLTTPDNVDAIMQTLEEQFGQPRYVIQSLLQKVRESQPPRDGKPESLIKFANNVKNLVVTVVNLDRCEYLVNPTLLEELVTKMDGHYRMRWGEFVVDQDLEVPNLKHFSKWLDRISRSAQVVAPVPEIQREEKRNHVLLAATGNEEKDKQNKCLFCGKPNHWVQDCKKLGRKPIAERIKWVKESKRCFGCLRSNHGVKDCRSKRECGVDGCSSFHHHLLHVPKKTNHNDEEKRRDEDEKKSDSTLCTSCTLDDSDVLLRFVEVVVVGPMGETKAWALCDEGATCSLLEANFANQLGIKGKKEELVLKWTNDLRETHPDSEIVNLKIKTADGRDVFTLNRVRTITDLQLPEQTVNMDGLKKKFPYLQHVPVSCQQAARPVLLIGEDNIRLTIAREVKEPKWQVGPVASKTKLGWTVHGPLHEKAKQKTNFSFVISTPSLDQELHQLVKESFKLESFGTSGYPPPKSEAEKRADILLKTTTARIDGKWETGLLWKEDNVQFPSSMKMALSRLESVERNMEKDFDLKNWYNERINYYLEAGYCQEEKDESQKVNTARTFYLPHFAASNPNKPNKRRLVFDAAAKACGVSLNDKLMVGPDLLNSLAGVLMRFRKAEVGFGADVKEMFHQIRIRKEDESAQRFLWRGGDRQREPKIMIMKVMIFGAASSPCSAQYVMRRNAEEWESQHPEAVRSIKENMYMDDLADSATTVEEAKNRIAAINKIQTDGGFPMLKWTSNIPEALEDVPPQNRAEPLHAVELKEESSVERVLGMFWRPHDDKLTFTFKFPRVNPAVVDGSQIPTKRDVLRMAMSLFDPLGIIAFYTIEARMLLQDIWRSDLDWDQRLHGKLLDNWNIWRKLLQQVDNIKVSRCYSPLLPEAEMIRVHIFCDASEKAYSSVAYLEVKHKTEKHVNFIFGRARVTPLKTLSIPRLELLGAVMAIRIGVTISEELRLPVHSFVYWTDSRNVLCWIRSDARKYKQFVGCRIGEILEHSEVPDWRWVPTEMNPADEATRDTTIEISSSNIWITGPKFLYEDEKHFPLEKKIVPPSDEELEVKAQHVHLIQVTQPVIQISRFSSFNKLIRTFAWTRRFMQILRIKARKQKIAFPAHLTPEDWKEAELELMKQVQKQTYQEEISALESLGHVQRKSSILKLSPFLENGLLRVGSRVANGPFSFDQKYPVILPGDHHLVKLLLLQKHVEFGHGNNDGVINDLRSRFWIKSAKNNLKKVISNCLPCRSKKAVPKAPRMGDLPEFRFGVNKPCFTYCGLDVFGPITITEGRRQAKRYVALFTCLTTRGIHLEKISSLDVDSMIMAIRRFVASHNRPDCFYSDNGTNMTGTFNEIKASIRDLESDKLESGAASIGIKWKFIPPASPHFGGCWERLIRCVKVSLFAALKSMHVRNPREEVLETLLREAANIVNSRPLTDLPTEPGADAITPNHFLKVNTTASATFGSFNDGDFSLRKQWRISQRMLDHFWTRWIREYLPTLHERKKWNLEQEPVKVGNFVYVADVNGIRGEWTKAIVVKTFPGKDGRVRVVEIRTPSGRIVKRPVTKCAVVNLEPGVGN